MFIVSGLKTVFRSASSVMVIIAATVEESLLGVEDEVVATTGVKTNPTAFPPIINATIKSNGDKCITIFFEGLIGMLIL